MVVASCFPTLMQVVYRLGVADVVVAMGNDVVLVSGSVCVVEIS